MSIFTVLHLVTFVELCDEMAREVFSAVISGTIKDVEL